MSALKKFLICREFDNQFHRKRERDSAISL